MIVLFFVLHCLNWTTNPVAYEISSSQSSCQNIPPPQNGRMQCNHQTGKFCTLQCDPGFEPQYEPAKAYLCNSNNGRWITYPEPDQMPWPDCVARKQISYPSTGTGQSRQNVERSGAAGQLSLLGSALKILKTLKKAPRAQATDYNRNIDSNQNYYASYKKNNFGNQEYTWTQNPGSPYQYFYNVINLQRSNEQGKTLDQNILRDNPIEEKPYSFVQNPYLPNVQLQPEAMTKPQPDQSSVVTGVPIYGDKRKLNDQWKAKTTRRINGIALDRPQYAFTDNKKLVMPVDAKREEVSKTTTNLTGNRNTTRHEETNVLDADQIGRNKDDKKAGKQKTKHSKKPKEHGKIYQQRTSKTKNKHGSTAAKSDHKTQKDRTEKINKEVNTTSNGKTNKTAETKPSDSVKPIEAAPQNTTKPVDTHLTGLATNLLNKTNNLSYQTLEEHRDNRTQHSQIDVTNVNNTRMEGSSQQETDIENISIATTKGVVPLLHNVTAKDTLSTPTKENVDKDLNNRNFSTSTPTEGSSAIKSKDVDIKTTKDANVNKNSSREIFDKNVDRNMKLFDNSKQSFANDTSSLTNNDKPLQALIHIEISHTPLKGVSTLKSPSEDSPATRDNIHMNTEEAKNFLEKLLGDNEENNKIKNEMTSKIIDTDENALDSRSIDLEKLQDARQTEIDQIIRKYFKDAELHSTDSAYNVVPPVPVFSSRDLRLLRLMVENTKNTKRSGLNNQAFTLWEKMLELTAERRHTSLEKHNLMGKLVSRKKLAEDDSKLANVIMKKVNNIDSFAFESKTNPFLELLKKNGGKYETALKSVTANKLSPESSSKKAKTYASFKDLYLDHVKQEKTLTNDPCFQEVRPASDFTDYSRSKNQLFMNDLRNKEPKASIVKYIKKQDDPPLQQPFKDNQPKLGSRRQYVWNGATFVPMEDRSAPSSYLNTDQGLSEKPSYKWTGASFIENDNNQEPTVSQPQPTSYQPPPSIPPSTPVPLPPEPPPPPPEAYQATSTPTKSYQEITNQEIQNILNLWNGDGQTHTEASSRSDSERPSTQQDPLPPSSPTVPIYEKDQEDNQVLYHWNGNSYQPIQTTDILPPHTIKYKSTVNGYVMTPESGQYLPTGGSSQDTASQQRDETNKDPVTLPTNPDLAPTQQGSPNPQEPTNARTTTSNFPTASSRLPNNNLDLSQIESILQSHYPPNNQRTNQTPAEEPQKPTESTNNQPLVPPAQPPPPQTANQPPQPPKIEDKQPTVNPYLPNIQKVNLEIKTDPRQSSRQDSTQQTTISSDTRPFTRLDFPQQNSMLSDTKQSSTQLNSISNDAKPLTRFDSVKPIRDEIEDLEQVITNDMNIKQEINALARVFTADSDAQDEQQQTFGNRFDSVNNGEISKSFSSFKDQLNDDTRTSFKENPPRENSIDKLTHRYSPIVSARLRDLKVKQEQIMDILKSIAPAKLNGERDTNRITIADKATAPAIRTNNLARELVSTTPFSPRGYMEELEKKKNTREGLNPKQIKDLLALTKLAELTAMKKQGVSHPTQSVKNTKTDLHTRARELLKRPRIRTLLRFLVRSRKSKNLLRFLRTSYNDTLKRTGDITKRHELTEKYNKALHRLLELWSKRLPTPSSVLKAMDSSHSVERSDTPKRSDGKNVLERFG